MKFEIEIQESDIRKALDGKINTIVTNHATSYAGTEAIRMAVASQWKVAIDTIVSEELANLEALRKQVADEITRKLRSQINAAMKAAE